MEQRKPQSKFNPNPNSCLILVASDTALLCQSQKSVVCQQRHGQFPAIQKRSKATRFCRDCQSIERRAKSAEWKHRKRHEVGWREYAEMYSPYVDQDEKRAYQRTYKREWRKRQREVSAPEPMVLRRAA